MKIRFLSDFIPSAKAPPAAGRQTAKDTALREYCGIKNDSIRALSFAPDQHRDRQLAFRQRLRLWVNWENQIMKEPYFSL